jgi:protein phosphatase
MGGHNAGNVASALTTKSIDNFFEATQFTDVPGPVAAEDIELHPEARRVRASIRKANQDVYLISSTHTQHQGMGSTVVAAYVSRETDQIHIGHVGDSRCYRMRGGEIKQLTKDHSLINDALELKPDLSQEELARLPKNIITRALGMKDVVKVDMLSERVEPGDTFLLCSDGLSGMVSEEQMRDVLAFTEDPREACELLIAMANEAGGTDNISALIIRIEAEAAKAKADSARRGSTTAPHRINELGSVLPPEGDESPAAAFEIDLGEPLPHVELDGDGDGHRITSIPGEPLAPPPPPRPASRRRASSGRYAAVSMGGRPAQVVDDPPAPKPRRQVEVRVARCASCGHELYIGNRFCVECGAPIKL